MIDLTELKKTHLIKEGDFIVVRLASAPEWTSAGIVKDIRDKFIVIQPSEESLSDKQLIENLKEQFGGYMLDYVILVDSDIQYISKMKKEDTDAKEETKNTI